MRQSSIEKELAMPAVVEKIIPSYDRLFIGGEWLEPSTDAVIPVVSPTTGQQIATVPHASREDVDRAVAAARSAFDDGPWPRMTPAERAVVLARVGTEVEARLEQMIEVFTAEIGAPTAASRAFHEMAVGIWADIATLPERMQFEQDLALPGARGSIVREPVGVVATVIPWNGPVAAASMKIGPALLAGCTVILKPAEEGPVTTMLLAEAFAAAGLPAGVVSIIPAGRETGEYLVSHPGVDKIAFTGSTAAGRRIMSLCGERIARITLELGGKSAAIIADDIDADSILTGITFAGVGHSGQVCAALTRILVPRQRQDEIVGKLAAIMENIVVGDPVDPETVLGPLASERQRDRVEEYIAIGLSEGARLVTGGHRPHGLEHGWFVEPTLFADVDNSMRIAQEEIFGPVLVVIPFDTIDEAVAIANDSPYGLSGAVYADDTDLAESIARRVRTGQMSINGWQMCVAEPFGGYKQSGLGREGGTEGVMSYLETKLIQRF
ncbi:MAG: aldehyde dehydrogenase [Subtercola sp.]|nr:aldehyde dehydrogenase [Subtercola sp.]